MNNIAMADALFGIFGMERVEMRMICPKAKRCNREGCVGQHAVSHEKHWQCLNLCRGVICVPVKAKRKGKK